MPKKLKRAMTIHDECVPFKQAALNRILARFLSTAPAKSPA
jgi:hypothetical protein